MIYNLKLFGAFIFMDNMDDYGDGTGSIYLYTISWHNGYRMSHLKFKEAMNNSLFKNNWLTDSRLTMILRVELIKNQASCDLM